MNQKLKGSALAGSRTRVYCLEGNNANRYTTNAVQMQVLQRYIYQTVLTQVQSITQKNIH